MTRIERERAEALARKAKAIREIWLREREEVRAKQLSANAEVRRGWKESGNVEQATPEITPRHFRRDR